MGQLTTHVLDVSTGKPAANVIVDVHWLDPAGSWITMRQIVTDSDGRTERPILHEHNFTAGTYMLTFHVGDHFKRMGVHSSAFPFLDQIPIRFSISDQDGHYHVPLLVTPWSYSTYRGS